MVTSVVVTPVVVLLVAAERGGAKAAVEVAAAYVWAPQGAGVAAGSMAVASAVEASRVAVGSDKVSEVGASLEVAALGMAERAGCTVVYTVARQGARLVADVTERVRTAAVLLVAERLVAALGVVARVVLVSAAAWRLELAVMASAAEEGGEASWTVGSV